MSAPNGLVVELKRSLASLVEENDRIGNAFKIEGKNVDITPEQAQTYRDNLAKQREIKSLIDDATASDEFKQYLAEEGKSVAMESAAAAEQSGLIVPPNAQAFGTLVKSLGEAFTDSEEFKALVKQGGATMPTPWEVSGRDITGYGQKDVYNAGYTGSWAVQPGLAGAQFDPMVPRQTRTMRVRDLFPVSTTAANLIDYFRVLGFASDRLDTSSSASVVPDRSSGAFGLKPQSSLTFQTAQAPVRTIAHYEVAHRNVLDDVPQLQSTINNELLYGLRLTEDAQILSGTGNGEDILGIYNTPGIQTHLQSSNAGDTQADAIRRALTKVELAYYEPTGVVIHPYDWEDVELTKGDTNDHYAITMNVAIGADKRLWSVPVVSTPATPEKTFLVGAFGLGAQIYDRQQANIRIAEQHADFFIRNAVVILAEQRLAMAVKRPESFVKGTLT
jgi:hypothetical protein